MKVDKGYTAVSPMGFEFSKSTRECLVCECKEDTDARYIDINKPWLCPRCKAVLQAHIKEAIEEGEKIGKH